MTTNRLLPIKNGRNFRDLGGYRTVDGHTVKWHRLIRSGHLNTLDQPDLDLLASLNITLDVDFRAPGEIKAQPRSRPSHRHLSPAIRLSDRSHRCFP